MKRIQITDLHLWQFDDLAEMPGIKHFVTDRSTHEAGEEFTLSFSSTPDKELVRRNRQLLAKAMGVDYAHLFFPSQVHKTRIVQVTAQTPLAELMETDALMTSQKGLCIAVMSA